MLLTWAFFVSQLKWPFLWERPFWNSHISLTHSQTCTPGNCLATPFISSQAILYISYTNQKHTFCQGKKIFFKASLIAVYFAVTRVEQETTAHFWGSKHGGAVGPPWQTLILALDGSQWKFCWFFSAYTLIAYIIVGTSGVYILRVGKFNLLNSFNSFSFSDHALFFSPYKHFYIDLILSWKSHFFNIFKNHVKNIFPFCEYALCPLRACAYLWPVGLVYLPLSGK